MSALSIRKEFFLFQPFSHSPEYATEMGNLNMLALSGYDPFLFQVKLAVAAILKKLLESFGD